MLGAVLAMTSLAPASSAAPSQGSGSQAPAQQGAQQEAPQEAQQGAQEQVLVFTAGDSVTDYMSVPSTATAGPATIVFENSANTGNTTGMPHTLSFSTTREGYNHDVDVDIVANPYDPNGGRYEVPVNLTPGEYYYVCEMAGHVMDGVLVVTDGGGDTDTTAPQVSAELSGDQNADGAYVGSATVTLSATDAGSGVQSVEYEIDDTGFQPYTEPVTVDDPGDHTVQFRATDNSGNTSPVGSTPFTVVEAAPQDVTAPQVSAAVSGDQNGAGEYVGSATVTVSASDSESGVAGVEYALDGQPFTAYSAPVTVNEPGAHTVSYRAGDNAGNVSEPQSVSFTVAEPAPQDTTAPEVSAALSGDQDADGAYVGSATVTLSASDAGSGVAGIEYSLDGAPYAAYTDALAVDQPGEHTLSYRASDNAGNTSDPQTVSFTVAEPAAEDVTAPQVSAAVSGDQNGAGEYVGSATVTLSASDSESGVAGVEYALDGQSFTAYSAPVTVNEPGAHTVSYRAGDHAGNVSEPQSVSFTVAEPAPQDTTAPEVSAALSGDQDADGAYVGAATVTLSASDAGSGVAGIEYSLDGAPYAAYTDALAVDQPGEHTLSYRASDNAGNTSDPQTVSFTVAEPASGESACPGADTRETVVIDGNDSGVANMDTGDGCTVNELIRGWASWANHGAFVSHVSDVTDALAEDGSLSSPEEAAIKRAAARSDIGRPLELLEGKHPLQGWTQAGPGSFSVEPNGVIATHGGMGLLWYEAQKFGEHTLHLDFRLTEASNNSGVFVGFPDAGDDPWVAVRQGEEVQINDNPDGDPQKTGAIYSEKPAQREASHPVGEWNSYDIVVRDAAITVYLNGTQVNHWVDDDPNVDLAEGYIGLQNHPPTSVQFRDIRVNEIGQ